MKHLITLGQVVLLLCTALTLGAQLPIDVLRAADARFHALDSYAATLDYAMGAHRDQGKVYYEGQKFQLDFPEDQTICDGERTLNYNRAFAHVAFIEAHAGPDLSLAGIYGLHGFPYRYSWLDTTGTLLRMRLDAVAEDLSPSKVLIGIGKTSGLIEEYTIYLNRGLIIDMQVMDSQLNPQLDPKLFFIDMDFVRRVENGEVAPVEHED